MAPPSDRGAGKPVSVKASPDRLYGRQRTHALRPRQRLLLAKTLPRFRLDAQVYPADAFADTVRQIWLEIGFGGGEHARAFAAANPAIGLIAAEVFEQGLCSMLAAFVREGEEETAHPPPNLRLWDDDARGLIASLPEASLDGAILMFPDPWPKARHAKRRFVHPDTARLLASRLKPGSEWRIASDDPTYQLWVSDVLAPEAAFRLEGFWRERPAHWPPTRYEEKALKARRQPLYWVWRRV